MVSESYTIHFPLELISHHSATTSPHLLFSFHYFVFQRLIHLGTLLTAVGKKALPSKNMKKKLNIVSQSKCRCANFFLPSCQPSS